MAKSRMPRRETKAEEYERRFFFMEGNLAQLRDELSEVWAEVMALRRELVDMRRERSATPKRRGQQQRERRESRRQSRRRRSARKR